MRHVRSGNRIHVMVNTTVKDRRNYDEFDSAAGDLHWDVAGATIRLLSVFRATPTVRGFDPFPGRERWPC